MGESKNNPTYYILYTLYIFNFYTLCHKNAHSFIYMHLYTGTDLSSEEAMCLIHMYVCIHVYVHINHQEHFKIHISGSQFRPTGCIRIIGANQDNSDDQASFE